VSGKNTKEAWRAIAERYQRLATESRGGPAVQLAHLVIAEYCVHMWSGSHGGPSLSMVALAEHILHARIDEIVAAELDPQGAS
jgi:hypothetical protein